MRQRITFGFAVPPMLDVLAQVRLAVLLERLGIQRLWFPDHLAFPDWSYAADVWTTLAAVAARTRRVQIATAVTDPHRAPPAVFAQRVATLDRLSHGRVIVGLGSGEAMNLDPYGIPWDRPVARLMEHVRIVRALLDSDGPVHFEGKFHRMNGGRLTIRPELNRHVPIYLAALGPKMQAFCGEMCDGWFPVTIPPAHYGHYFEPIAAAARAAGRDPDAIDRVALLPLALVDNAREMRPQVVKAARRYALTLVWPPVLERMGTPLNPPEHLRGYDYRSIDPTNAEHIRLYKEMQHWIPEDVLLSCVFYGDMATLKAAVGAYIDAGATSINIVNVSPNPVSSTVRLATELLPAFLRRPAPLAARAMRFALPLIERVVKIPQQERSVQAT